MLVAFAWIVLAVFARAQDAIRIAPRPAWVDPVAVEDRATDGALRGPVDYLLFDFQDDARGTPVEAYVHVAKRVLNEQGVQHQSEVSIDFDPTCQDLTVHTVAILRDGKTIDALGAQKFQIIQRESQLDRQVYDGTRTALLFIQGVRVGDVIDLEYTLRGRSPLFEGRYFSSFVTQLTMPVHRMRKRVLWRDDRTLFHRGHGIDAEPTVRTIDGVKELVWDFVDREAVVIESDVPSWYEALPWIQSSEYRSWSEVARWGAKLFTLPQDASPAVSEVAAGLRSEKLDSAEELRRALRFVQGEIRYLSIALGEGSHRPSSPEQVLERRYGDCKDKALLLVAILRELGIEARPALVNTTRLHAIEDWIATPDAFDHVIVRASAGGDEWWVDPTMNHERSPLSEQSLLEYGRALVLDAATTDLSVVTRDQGARSTTTIAKTFEVGIDGATKFQVETVYEGADANFIRSGLAWQTTQELTDRCRDFYLADYPSLSVEAPAEVIDQAEQNRVVVREKYAIADLFGRETSEGWGRFHAREIYHELRAPETTRRGSPVGLAHPRHITCKTSVILPDDWQIEPETVSIQNPSMRFEHEVAYTDRRLDLRDEYQTLRDHVPVAECAAFAADIQTASEHLSYEISDPRGGGAGMPSDEVLAIIGGVVILGVVASVCALIFGIVWITRRKQPTSDAAPIPFPAHPMQAGVPAFAVPRHGVWRDGSILVMDLQDELPSRCIYCNRDAVTRVSRRFSWHPPLLYLLILAGVLIYAVVAAIVSKRARIQIPLCEHHDRRRSIRNATVAALFIGGIAGCAAGAMKDGSIPLFWLGGVACIAALLVVSLSRLSPKRIDDREIRLRGAGQEFLDGLDAGVQDLRRAA